MRDAPHEVRGLLRLEHSELPKDDRLAHCLVQRAYGGAHARGSPHQVLELLCLKLLELRAPLCAIRLPGQNLRLEVGSDCGRVPPLRAVGPRHHRQFLGQPFTQQSVLASAVHLLLEGAERRRDRVVQTHLRQRPRQHGHAPRREFLAVLRKSRFDFFEEGLEAGVGARLLPQLQVALELGSGLSFGHGVFGDPVHGYGQALGVELPLGRRNRSVNRIHIPGHEQLRERATLPVLRRFRFTAPAQRRQEAGCQGIPGVPNAAGEARGGRHWNRARA
mmetsp:Transcript_57533/g.136896  ORF Transcript_57533/g.136896 Transcript_57533/m.136896 type:complete len:276 (-) Transcript_57533:74-901(-)